LISIELKTLDFRKGAYIMTQLRFNPVLSSGLAFLFGLGVAVFGYYASSSIPEAHANPTGMQAPTSGGHPYVNLTGTHSSNSDLVLYTVPSDRIFILTGILGYSESNIATFNILENTTLRINYEYINHPRQNNDASGCNYLCNNQGHIVFSAGSQVVLQFSGVGSGTSSHRYMIEGYLANPG
jgi:hypothetical protein